PFEKGGKNLLNLEHRNDAIELMWLKGLLAPKNSRPCWAPFAHAILAKHARHAPVVHPDARINTFLQSWSPTVKKLPPHLKRMLRAAKKYSLQWTAPLIPKDLAQQLPIWFHIGATSELNRLNNFYYAACLRDNHRISTVGQMEQAAASNDPQHRKQKECPCTKCEYGRTHYGCQKPFKCQETAQKVISCLPEKWYPDESTTEPTPELRLEQHITNNETLRNGDVALFDNQLSLKGHVENGFRIFTPS
ncbi:hypothetical protein M405DRAFT_692869, partial [Rhizopogon salebrosus TDB-379]